jgi:CheY-like chemotaxis protein
MKASGCAATAAAVNAFCRVLIVEDHVDSSRALALVLRGQGHDVQTARNGTEALTVAATYLPHVVLIDIGLPGLDGHYVTRQLRKTQRDVFVVAMTGRNSPEDFQRSRDAGCDHHLVKPLDLAEVLNLIADWKVRGGCAETPQLSGDV